MMGVLDRACGHHLRHAFDKPSSRAPLDFCTECLSVWHGQCIEVIDAHFAWGCRHFSIQPLPPRLHIGDNGLPAFRYVDMLHSDRLLAARPVLA
jgi:hypothetical protein